VILGEDSFYKPYLDVVGNPCTMLDWTKEEIEFTEDPKLIEELACF